MGDVADEKNGVARFTPGFKYILESVRVRFKGSGDQNTATLQMILDHQAGGTGIDSPFDFILEEWATMGFDAAGKEWVNWWRPSGARELFTFDAKSAIVFEWTDPGTTLWGIEVGVIRA